MQCPNCKNQISDTANKCSVCGVHINQPPVSTKAGFPDWAKGLLAGTVVGLGLLIFLGIAYFFFYLKSAQSSPQPTQALTMIVEPTHIPPTLTKIVLTATPPATTTPTATPTQSPTATPEPQYCDAFEGLEMTIVYMDWKRNEPLALYFKMPGGVPGLEKEIPGASDEWKYRVEIGDYKSSKCEVIAGYKERLYCEIILPAEYEAAVHPMSLYVNKCEKDIYINDFAFLPEIEKK